MEKRTPLVSIVILNWNGEKFLKDCLNSLFPQSYKNYEVIFVDNKSTDGSVEFVKKNYPKVKVYAQRENLEFARGNNLGFKMSKGEFVIALNADTALPYNFVEEMVKPAMLDERVGSVSCNINTQGSLTRYAPVITRGEVISSPLERMLSEPIFVVAACGAAALYRKSIIDKFWGYDEEFITNWEDHSLGYRIWVLGYYCVHNPKITISHIGSASYGKFNVKREKKVIENKFATYYLNKEKSLYKILKWFLDDSRRFIPNSPLFVTRTFFGSLGLCLKLRKKRQIIQNNRKFSDHFILNLTDGNSLWLLDDKIIF